MPSHAGDPLFRLKGTRAYDHGRIRPDEIWILELFFLKTGPRISFYPTKIITREETPGP